MRGDFRTAREGNAAREVRGDLRGRYNCANRAELAMRPRDAGEEEGEEVGMKFTEAANPRGGLFSRAISFRARRGKGSREIKRRKLSFLPATRSSVPS